MMMTLQAPVIIKTEIKMQAIIIILPTLILYALVIEEWEVAMMKL